MDKETHHPLEEEFAHRMNGMSIADKLLIIDAMDSEARKHPNSSAQQLSPEAIYKYCVSNIRI